MAYSFTQIEKNKTNAIAIILIFLVSLYLLAFGAIATIMANRNAFEQIFAGESAQFRFLPFFFCMIVFCVAVMVAILQWLLTVQGGLVDNVSRLMGARNVNLEDEHHVMFANIVDEVSVATGGMKIRPMVIPTLALNAFAIADGDATPVIGITQGLLYKLTRAQLEAVVGHEAAHVVSGDCESTTIISSMFEIFEAFALGIQAILRGIVSADEDSSPPSGYRSGGRYDGGQGGGARGSGGVGPNALRLGGVLIVIVLITVLIFFVNFLARCMRMLISRQREYRADAVAVRLTRDPLSLAQALYIIGRRRHQLSNMGDSFESFFIVNPKRSFLSESEGLFADLFSTHPPLNKRIKILLAMSRAVPESLERALAISREKEAEITGAEKKRKVREPGATGGVWLVQKGDEWRGPFSMETVIRFDWVTPETRVQHAEGGAVLPLAGVPQFQHVHQQSRSSLSDQEKICPACSGELEDVFYEQVNILRCKQCAGVLCSEGTVGVLLNRREKTFDARIQAMAQTLEQERRAIKNEHLNYKKSDRFYRCKECHVPQRPFIQRLFNQLYPVEVDKCPQCGLTWFDKDELEVLQYMCKRMEDQSQRPDKTVSK
jgi:heat shock protein HtpX